MSDPIPDVPAVPDVTAAALLGDLVAALHADPLTAVMVSRPAYESPFYKVKDGALSVDYYGIPDGAQVLTAAKSLLGGEVTVADGTLRNRETHTLTTLWGRVPLTVSVPIEREDEVAVLRKRLAELESAEVYRQAQLAERQHQLADPAVPVLGVSL